MVRSAQRQGEWFIILLQNGSHALIAYALHFFRVKCRMQRRVRKQIEPTARVPAERR